MTNGVTLFNHYLARIASLEADLRIANEATTELLSRAATAERLLREAYGLLFTCNEDHSIWSDFEAHPIDDGQTARWLQRAANVLDGVAL